jgi:ABC-type transporter Mla subunit MlaD
MSQTSIPGTGTTLSELDRQIDAVRDNIRELVEQAAGYSGAADDDLASTRIAKQEALLAQLVQERDGRSRKAT